MPTSRQDRRIRICLTRQYTLPALHTLGAEGLTEEENFQLFGPCSQLHGHDYHIEVTVSGKVDDESGRLIAPSELDALVCKLLIDPLRGRNLSDHFDQTTGEALAIAFHRKLASGLLGSVELVSVNVRETPKNSFSVGELR
jgi:6-pyruvoyltetrahydropterin/6-carboxytetrahydropterin synthase